jgi:hypothetical protein
LTHKILCQQRKFRIFPIPVTFYWREYYFFFIFSFLLSLYISLVGYTTISWLPHHLPRHPNLLYQSPTYDAPSTSTYTPDNPDFYLLIFLRYHKPLYKPNPIYYTPRIPLTHCYHSHTRPHVVTKIEVHHHHHRIYAVVLAIF